MKKKWFKKIPVVIAIASLGVFVFSSVVMLLWNNILPGVLHVGAITFWQAAGILVLSKLFFGGMRRPGGAGMWKRRMHMKWKGMTEEQREEFRSRMRTHNPGHPCAEGMQGCC
jgi:hypothetical protein